MISPYKIVVEDDTTLTYEYNSVSTWVLYGILAILFFGMVTENGIIELFGAALILVYFAIRIPGGKSASAHIKSALNTQSVIVSGRKHSFNNPLRVKISKNA